MDKVCSSCSDIRMPGFQEACRRSQLGDVQDGVCALIQSCRSMQHRQRLEEVRDHGHSDTIQTHWQGRRQSSWKGIDQQTRYTTSVVKTHLILRQRSVVSTKWSQ